MSRIVTEIVTSDLHLRDCLWADVPDATGDDQLALDELDRIVTQTEASRVIMAGDIFHVNTPSPRVVGNLLKKLCSFAERGIRTFSIPGQHCRHTEGDWIDSLGCQKFPMRESGFRVETVDDVTIIGLGYTPPSELKNRLQSLSDHFRRGSSRHIVMLHQSWDFLTKGSKACDGSKSDLEYAVSGLRNPPLVITGDYHGPPEVVRLNENDQAPTLVYSPGPLTPSNGQPEFKCYVGVVRILENGQMDVYPARIQTRPIVDIRCPVPLKEDLLQKMHEATCGSDWASPTLQPLWFVRNCPEPEQGFFRAQAKRSNALIRFSGAAVLKSELDEIEQINLAVSPAEADTILHALSGMKGVSEDIKATATRLILSRRPKEEARLIVAGP